VVGEHSSRVKSNCEVAGAAGKANVGMSNDKMGEKPLRRKTKVS
jgi:hypothetical protein